ncbi:uncharacterized protein LOC120692736 isoform X2 [Panicum virgatum]|uniref:Endonuclease/exonuclease/phosphatase domain-containing protein n=1 Tax=Panicum virgatum TaxID=38727 RepID=A0A8T0N0L8_PANVG|nr:uncharacterized protein LOC120692736 isoform X2 [Panicum virgatum]KAG2540576.1 hypothetical protein PVAP13_9NG574100 [Panicum virgatum]
MATVKDALQRLIDGLRSLPPRRRPGRRASAGTSSSKGPRVVVIGRPASGSPDRAAAQQRQPASSAPVTIRVATFNAAMFSLAPAVPPAADDNGDEHPRGTTGAGAWRHRQQQQQQPRKGILKAQCPQSPAKQLRVSINLQDDEITASERGRKDAAGGASSSNGGGAWKGKAAAAGDATTSSARVPEWRRSSSRRTRSMAEVLREVGADIVALQNVRAEQGRGMRPLSDLAVGLGMRYVFAESWAPEYGNAVLSRWPIKRWKAHRVADQSDFRNVLRVTVDVPGAGEVNFHCTHLDHLDEGLRMKQVNSILRSADGHHILAGGLNALDPTDYSADHWANIVKFYEEIGKPTPKTEVMRYLKLKRYVDAKDFAGECEAVVVVAKGQDVQGTCKYGTRVDYILASPNSPYKFVPGSYAVVSSKGTSDHHIVKADVTVAAGGDGARSFRRQRVVRMSKGSTKGIWAAR